MKIELDVKTQQKFSKVEMRGDGIVNVFVKSSPIDNKANVEIVELLSEYYNASIKSKTLTLNFPSRKLVSKKLT